MGKVIHFELPVDDGERARAFYSEVFGWDTNRYGEFPYWLVDSGSGVGPPDRSLQASGPGP